MLAYAATGQGPFGTGTTAALLYRVVHGAPTLDQVPPEVRPLIERCLAKDPRERPTAAGLLAEVGALQPGGNWLPDSIIRAFNPESAPGPTRTSLGSGAGVARLGSGVARLGCGGGSRQARRSGQVRRRPQPVRRSGLVPRRPVRGSGLSR